MYNKYMCLFTVCKCAFFRLVLLFMYQPNSNNDTYNIDIHQEICTSKVGSATSCLWLMVLMTIV